MSTNEQKGARSNSYPTDIGAEKVMPTKPEEKKAQHRAYYIMLIGLL